LLKVKKQTNSLTKNAILAKKHQKMWRKGAWSPEEIFPCQKRFSPT
jgi:hypothetical protein